MKTIIKSVVCVLPMAVVLIILYCSILSEAERMDALAMQSEIDFANLSSISTITGKGQLTYMYTTDYKQEFHARLGLDLPTGERISHLGEADIAFTFDFVQEKARWSKIYSSSAYSVVNKNDWQFRNEQDYKVSSTDNLVLSTRHYIFAPFEGKIHNVMDPESGDLIATRKVMLEEGESFEYLLDNMFGVPLLSPRYILTQGKYRLPDSPARLFNRTREAYNNGKLNQLRSFTEEEISTGVFKYELNYKDGSVYTCIIDQSIPACIYNSGRIPGGERRSYEMKWEKWNKYEGIAFPGYVKYRYYYLQDGVEVEDTLEEYTFSEIAINKPINPNSFTLEDMGVTEEDWIGDRTNGINFPVSSYLLE